MILRLGTVVGTQQSVSLNTDSLRTHLHLVGATGSGKSSAIHVLLRQLMLADDREKACIFVFDPLGNLSRDLLRLIAYERYTPQHVRDRLVYLEPANKDAISTFNPLLHTDENNRYYQTMRAVELILRAFDAQNLAQQPRLLQWMTKAFTAAAMVGFPISVCRFLLYPGTEYHDAILQRIPGEIGHQWKSLLKARNSEADRILDSTRNRLDPFFQSPSLRLMFGVPESRFDCARMIRERKVVLINLSEQATIPNFICDTIGSLYLNEIFQTCSALAVKEGKRVVDPTYLFLDEFQRYVGPDIEDALPTLRQMGLRMVLAHQSFDQLEREDVDLRSMIWQARTRLAFANYEKDADSVVEEFSKMTYDDMEIKDRRTTTRQLIDGFRKEVLKSWSETSSSSISSGKNKGSNEGTSKSYNYASGEFSATSMSLGESTGISSGESEGESQSRGSTSGNSESLVPIHRTFDEVSSITYRSFDEHTLRLGKKLRGFKSGEAFFQRPGSVNVEHIQLEYLLIPESASNDDAVARLLEKNFSSETFVSVSKAQKDHDHCLKRLANGEPLSISGNSIDAQASPKPDNPFGI